MGYAPTELEQPTLEQIMDTFVPVRERSWYPFEFPEAEWWDKNEIDNPDEITKFVNHIKQLATEDFFFFCDNIMRDFNNPKTVPLDPDFHGEICFITAYDADTLILVPRNHLKTTIAGVAYHTWRLFKNPNDRIVSFSDVLDMSKKFLSEVKENIERNKRLQLIAPNLKPQISPSQNRNQKWGATEIIVERDMINKDPSIVAGSTEQVLTGGHANLIDFDDIVTDRNMSKRDMTMKDIFQWHQSVTNIVDREFRQKYKGTRYHDNDLYGYLIEEGLVTVYVRSAVEEGEYIWNDPGNVARVKMMRKKLTPQNFSCQYMNDPLVEGEENFPFVARYDNERLRFEFVPDPPENDIELHRKFLSTLDIHIMIDIARTKTNRSDYTVIMVGGCNNAGRLFILDYLRKRMLGPEIEVTVVEWFEAWNPVTMKIETYGGDVFLYQYIRKAMKEKGLPLHKFKELEKNHYPDTLIKSLQIPVSRESILIPQGDNPRWEDEVVYEFTRYPVGKHDDILVTIAHMWNEQAKKKPEKRLSPDHSGFRQHLYQPSFESNQAVSWMGV